jgi:hypothetical protein
MIVNLYVDHMMAVPATSSDDVWAATRDHSKLFAEAADRIGLSPAEYHEFRMRLLDGKVLYVRLPHRVDAMAGDRRGSVYAVKNAYMTDTVMGWSVKLADGNTVYVPAACGNISLLRGTPPIAIVPHKVVRVAHHRKPKFVPALGVVATTPVVVAAPVVAAAPVAVAAAPVAAAGGGHGPSGFLFAIPAVIGGILLGTTHGGGGGGGSTVVVPPCSQGSNLLNACQIH